MVGRSVSFKTEKVEANPKEVILSIKDLVVNENRGIPAVKGLSLDVRAGEVVGIAGIDGNGQSELIQAITGLRKVKSGSITIKGEEVVGKTPRKITEMQVSHVPEDRHRDGLVLPMTVAENFALQTYYKEPISKNGILNYNIINEKHALMEEFDVRGASELVPIKALSGGNQQKAIIAREIDRNPDLFIVSQPTRGLDVGAIEYIRKRLIAERDKGKAVLVVSFELDEILDVSDRIAVIHDGVIHGIVEPAKTNKQELGVLMAGGHIEKEKNMLNKYKNLALPLMAVVSGILLGAIVMLVFGYDPIWGYEELFYSAFGNIKSIGEIFRAMAPLVFTALGFAVASRAGFFNVGLSGQAYVGWVLLDGLPWQILTYHVQF